MLPAPSFSRQPPFNDTRAANCSDANRTSAQPIELPARQSTRVWDGFCATVVAPLVRRAEERNTAVLDRHNFVHSDIETSAGRVHAVQTSSGTGTGAVIFIHGLSSSAAGNAAVLSMLVGIFKKVAALDLLCHGDSEHVQDIDQGSFASAAHEAAKHIALQQQEPVVLIGHSMGAYLTLDAGCKDDAQSWLRAVVAGSPPGVSIATQQERNEAVGLFKMERGRDAFKVGRRACPERNVVLLPLIAAVAWLRFRQPSVQSVIRSDVASCMLSDEKLAGLKVPALICWGHGDQIVPLHHLEHLRQVMPSETTRILTDAKAGHSNFADAAPVFVDGIAAFVSSVDGAIRDARKPPRVSRVQKTFAPLAPKRLARRLSDLQDALKDL